MDVPPFAALRLNNTPRVYRCEPGWRWSPPPLPDYDLWCVLDGEGEMRLGEKSYPLRPGVGFVVPPGSRPQATQAPARRLVVFAVHFDPLDAEGGVIPPERLLPPQGVPLRDVGFFAEMAARCEAARARGDGLGRRQAVLLTEQMLLHLYEEAENHGRSPVDARIAEIARAIRAAPGEAWPVEEQARRACLSRSQYTRRFLAATGESPTRFVVRVRLERAAQLLRETDMTVSEIAAVLGYRDLFFFSRQFKRHRGVAPSELRKAGR